MILTLLRIFFFSLTYRIIFLIVLTSIYFSFSFQLSYRTVFLIVFTFPILFPSTNVSYRLLNITSTTSGYLPGSLSSSFPQLSTVPCFFHRWLSSSLYYRISLSCSVRTSLLPRWLGNGWCRWRCCSDQDLGRASTLVSITSSYGIVLWLLRVGEAARGGRGRDVNLVQLACSGFVGWWCSVWCSGEAVY